MEQINLLLEKLSRRHIDANYCATAKEAIDLILNLIPQSSSITWGGSMTIRDMGLTDALKNSLKYNIIDRDTLTTAEEKREAYIKAFDADFYLTSANAITKDGVIINIDGNGNRVAAITWGPKKVILIISVKKIAENIEEALKRAREVAAPINAQRFDIKTPCKADCNCHNCNSTQSICNYIHFLRNSPGNRHHVILLGEDFGY